MTEIPDDIVQTVGKILGKPEYSVRAANYDAVSLKLALALLAERNAGKVGMELAAQIADAYAEGREADARFDKNRAAEFREQAALIRDLAGTIRSRVRP